MAASTALQVVVSPILGTLCENLSSLIHKEVGLIWGVDKEMNKLANTLSTITDVLEDAEEKQITDKAVANWLLKLKDLAYDADDILHEWALEATQLNLVSKHQVRVPYFSCFSFEQVLFRRKIAKRVNDLRRKFEYITLEKTCFDLHVGVVDPRRLLRETSSLSPDPYDVYGRDKEKEFIVRHILDNVGSGGACVSVHPIVGIGGLGKTTLAQVCYNDPRVQDHFDVKVWVSVSDDFDVKRLTRAVISSIVGDTCNLEELDPLQCLLQKEIGGKRFLLVLDDVWNDDQEEWSRFESSLRCGATGSSVIVTTRLKIVASITGTRPPLFLNLMSEEDCWSLFRHRAFGMRKGNSETPSLLKIGHEIVKKCGGVPLAAKVLGGLLRFKPGEKEWLNVRDSRIWELPQTDGNTILPVLRLSYIHLAPHLRQCFAYCSLFPKHYRLKKDDLIRLWVANGFIQSKGERQMEDIGDEIFNELSWRSFFQDERKSSVGTVVYCRMHDLIHDLACSINMNECFHLAESIGIRNVHLGTRHLSIDLATESYVVTKSLHQLVPKLRTLMLLNYDFHGESVIEVSLKSLRALSLELVKYHGPVNRKLLDSLGNLKHLRYLNISFSGVELLPDSLCELRNLQTLELESCRYLKKLPTNMGTMSSLRHLNIRRCDKLSEMPIKMGKLISLRTLSLFIVGPDDGRRINELQALDHLSGEVEIKGLEHVKSREEAKEANLMRKKNIVSLKLVWSNVDSDGENCQRDVLEGLQPHPNIKRLLIQGHNGLTIPSWLKMDASSFLPNLVDISISKSVKFC